MDSQIVMRKVAELKPYKNNPRKNDKAVDAVAASIKAFGFKQPIVIDINDEVIAGDTRLKAAKKKWVRRSAVRSGKRPNARTGQGIPPCRQQGRRTCRMGLEFVARRDGRPDRV